MDDSSFFQGDVQEAVAAIFRNEGRRVFATLVRLTGDFDLAEEALQDAFATALEQWTAGGLPAQPRAWLVSTGRFKAIDALRRRARLADARLGLLRRSDAIAAVNAQRAGDQIVDDRLRLIFACCHPAIAAEVRVVLTLREVCGLTTEEIAAAFLVAPATMAQRLVRGKAKIRDAGIPVELPAVEDLPARLDSVLAVIYLVFSEGYSATHGDRLTRSDLSQEAIRLGRLVVELLPEPEAVGLLALMLLQDSRRLARSTPEGDVVLLEDQMRSQWDQAAIAEGLPLVAQALAAPQPGPYALQAAIAAAHARASRAEATAWGEIVGRYDQLLAIHPSPIVELNRAVAVAMRDGPAAGLLLCDELLARGELAGYHLAHAARADMCRRLGRLEEAASSYAQALELARQEPERRFLARRLAECGA